MANGMLTTSPVTSLAAAKWALRVQGVLVLAALLVSLAPTPGAAAIYVPLTEAAHAHGAAWVRSRGGTLLGAGPLPGSLLIRGQISVDILSAAAQGALLLSVPDPLCGTQLDR